MPTMRPALLLVVALLAVLLIPAGAAAEEPTREIHLKSGEVLEVVVVGETDSGLRVRTADGAVIEVPFGDIRYVRAIAAPVGPPPEAAPPAPPEKTAEERERERLDAEMEAERRRWQRARTKATRRGKDPRVELWRKPARGIGLGTGIPFFTAGVGIASMATPYSIIVGFEGFEPARNTGVLLMGAFIPSGVLGSLFAHEALLEAGGSFDTNIEFAIAGGVSYSIGLGLFMIALDWQSFETPEMAAPFGIASIPTLIVGFVLLCSDIDLTTRAAATMVKRHIRGTTAVPIRPVPWAAPADDGAIFGVAARF